MSACIYIQDSSPAKNMFVVAFNRNRDQYQVPLALCESSRLHGLVTDMFLPSIFASLCILGHRTCAGLPWRKVKWNLPALLIQLIGVRAAKSDHARRQLFASLDQGLSIQAGATAKKYGADLLMYSGCALEAFESCPKSRRILFIYHPHGFGTDPILRDDLRRFPEVKVSHEWHMSESAALESSRLDKELELSTEVIFASSFTRNTLPAHFRAIPHHVIPYGCDANADAVERNSGPTKFLFVGQGVQRKGLHHLLYVWEEFRSKNSAELTVITSRCDPWIESEIGRLGVRRFASVSAKELTSIYDASDVMVLPSLVEGFGLVFMEALGRGCHVIGTSNTGLPDLDLSKSSAQVIRPGDQEELLNSLRWAHNGIQSRRILRRSIVMEMIPHSWSNFRKNINNKL